VYIGQSLRFVRPVFVDDTITGEVKVLFFQLFLLLLIKVRHIKYRKFDSSGLVTCHSQAVNQDGQVVIEGDAQVLIPKIKTPEYVAKEESENKSKGTGVHSESGEIVLGENDLKTTVDLAEGILKHDRRCLAKAITLGVFFVLCFCACFFIPCVAGSFVGCFFFFFFCAKQIQQHV
jgi:hypothetical protein